ncbi:hypothetical protein B566_EDAN013412, partial [Ephemera danica]
AVGCANRCTPVYKISFHKYPFSNAKKLDLWIAATKRKNWKPTKYSLLCGKHFQTGKPSLDPNHPDYVPNIFVFSKEKKRNADLVHQRKVRAQGRARNKMKTAKALQVCDTIHNEGLPCEPFDEVTLVQDITMLNPEPLDDTLVTTLQGVHTPEAVFQEEQTLQQTLPEVILDVSTNEDQTLDINLLLNEFQKVVKLNSDLQSENARLLERVEALEYLLEQSNVECKRLNAESDELQRKNIVCKTLLDQNDSLTKTIRNLSKENNELKKKIK